MGQGGLVPADEGFAARLRQAVPGLEVRAPEPRYLEEPRGLFRAGGGIVVLPRRTEEVAAILRLCHAGRVAVVPYGGGTGLVGGQIAGPDLVPVILSLERMAAVRGLWPDENVMIVEAGAILADVQRAAEAAGRVFPLSLASEGSARIGGLLSANAGGVAVLAHGNARDLCLGIEAVLPDGTMLGGLKRLRKDNTGYDLRNLLIGAEGTLGVITAAALKLSPTPEAVGTALMVVRDPAAALALLTAARDRFGPGVEAFELISGMGLAFLAETMPEVRQPFAPRPDWMVLIELGLFGGVDPAAALESLFEQAVAAEWVSDGVIAQSEAQRADLWTLRESIPLANRKVGSIVSNDISLPLSEIPAFIDEARAALSALAEARVNCFGHLGDGNLHFNVFPVPGRRAADYGGRDAMRALVHDLVVTRDGSISAEHGIGRLKVADLRRHGDPGKLAAMRAIKAALDPHGIMNPGAVLDPAGD